MCQTARNKISSLFLGVSFFTEGVPEEINTINYKASLHFLSSTQYIIRPKVTTMKGVLNNDRLEKDGLQNQSNLLVS